MKKIKQIIAIIAIVLLLGLYIATFITAIINKEATGKAFAICLVLSAVIPVIAYLLILVFGRAYGKRIISDPEPIIIPDNSEAQADEEASDTDEEASDIDEALADEGTSDTDATTDN